MAETVAAAANPRPLGRRMADALSLLWLRLRLWLGFSAAVSCARALARATRVVQALWQPLVVFLASTAFLIWLGEGLVSAAHDPIFHWWKLAAQWIVPIVVAFFVLRWALQARRRVVVGQFVDYRPDKAVVLDGLGNLIVTKLLRFRDLYRIVADQPVDNEGLDQPEIDTDRAIVAAVKVEDVSDFGAISSEATMKVGMVDVPVGLLMTIFGRLVKGPRISGGVHARADGLTLVAQLVDSNASSGWRVDDPEPLLQRDRSVSRDLDDMATELACRIFTDLALSGSVNWRATFRFSEGLRRYRNRLRSRRDRPLVLRKAEHCFRQALAADQRFGLAYYTYYNLGLVYNELQRLEAADCAFAEAIERFPGRWEAVYALAWTRYRLIEQQGSIGMDRTASQPRLEGVVALCARVIELHSFTRRKRTLPAVAAAVALAKAFDLKGSAERQLERWEEAVESRRQAVRYSWWAHLVASLGDTRTARMRTLAASCLRDLAVAYQHEQVAAPAEHMRDLIFRRSEAVFRCAIALNPSDARMHFELAEVYSKWGKPVEAVAQWECAFRIRPSLRQRWHQPVGVDSLDSDTAGAACLRRARELRTSGDRFNALAAAEESIALDPFSAIGHLELGQIHFEVNDVRRALQAWEDALLLNPDEPSLYRRTAMCHWLLAQEATDVQGRHAELDAASEYLEMAVERYGSRDPLEKAASHYWLAMLYLAKEDYSRAASQLRVVAAGGFAPLAVNLRLGEVLLRLKTYDEALVCLNSVVELGSQLQRSGVAIDGELGRDLGDWLSLDEALAWAHCWLASLFVDRDVDLPAAIKELGRAGRYVRRIEDSDVRARCEAAQADCEGWAFYKQGDTARAIPRFERALSLGAREQTHWRLAKACFRGAETADQEEEAVLFLRRAEAHCDHVDELDLGGAYRDNVTALRLEIERAQARMREAAANLKVPGVIS